MRNKAPLALMEQAIMLCVFALAAVLCLQAFLWADRQSEQSAQQDRAILQAQNAAEAAKHCHGDLDVAAQQFGGQADEGSWNIWFDEDWQQVGPEGAYRLCVPREHTAVPGLGRAVVEVTRTGGGVLTLLPVAWQEVIRDGE